MAGIVCTKELNLHKLCSMKKQLAELEKISKLLEPDQKDRLQIRQHVIDYTEDFLNTIEGKPAYVLSKENGIGLLQSPIQEEPVSIEAIIDLVHANVDTP
jgi:hypothetical protein